MGDVAADDGLRKRHDLLAATRARMGRGGSYERMGEGIGERMFAGQSGCQQRSYKSVKQRAAVLDMRDAVQDERDRAAVAGGAGADGGPPAAGVYTER